MLLLLLRLLLAAACSLPCVQGARPVLLQALARPGSPVVQDSVVWELNRLKHGDGATSGSFARTQKGERYPTNEPHSADPAAVIDMPTDAYTTEASAGLDYAAGDSMPAKSALALDTAAAAAAADMQQRADACLDLWRSGGLVADALFPELCPRWVHKMSVAMDVTGDEQGAQYIAELMAGDVDYLQSSSTDNESSSGSIDTVTQVSDAVGGSSSGRVIVVGGAGEYHGAVESAHMQDVDTTHVLAGFNIAMTITTATSTVASGQAAVTSAFHGQSVTVSAPALSDAQPPVLMAVYLQLMRLLRGWGSHAAILEGRLSYGSLPAAASSRQSWDVVLAPKASISAVADVAAEQGGAGGVGRGQKVAVVDVVPESAVATSALQLDKYAAGLDSRSGLRKLVAVVPHVTTDLSTGMHPARSQRLP